MSDQPEKKRARLLISSFDKKRIFNEIYGTAEILSDDFFEKNSEELIAENTQYSSYYNQLKIQEHQLKLQEHQLKLQEDKLESIIAKSKSEKFINKFFGKIDENVLILICNRLDSLLFDLIDEKHLDYEQKEKIVKIISECTENDRSTCSIILDILKLNQSQYQIALSSINDNTESVIRSLYQYIQISKYTNNNESVFKSISFEIEKLTNRVYANRIDPDNPRLSSFASIVGPSLMGKTQFAFSLARISPVFYVNFASGEGLQEIYKAFDDISGAFKRCLTNDVGILNNANIQLDSTALKNMGLKMKLETVGFLWELVKYSTEFEFDGSAEWFEYYLAARSIKFEKISIHEYLMNLGKS